MFDVWHLSKKEIDELKGAQVVVSMSGGKDSTACALLLERHGIEFERVFMDTGWEHPALYQYIADVLEPRFGNVTVLKSKRWPGGMVDMVRHKGGFPDRKMRFCTAYLKVDPFCEYVSAAGGAVLNVIGVRREESEARKSADRWAYDEKVGCEVFRPLVDHTFDDVIAMHREAGIAPNPLYLQGASRVGCFPCIYSRKSEIDQVAKLWPDRIDQIAELEAELTNAAHVRWDQDQDWRKKQDHKIIRRVAYLNSLEGLGVSWQALKNYDAKKATLSEDYERLYLREFERLTKERDLDAGYLEEKRRQLSRTFFHGRTDSGVREVAAWAETDRGGRQLKLFDMTARDGCTRWGMCESPLADSELVKIRDPDS